MVDIADTDLFLGGKLDPVSKQRTGELLGYDPHRFTTHGVIVGMTGSGKTGLGIVMIEEVLSKGIPALIIDPKGDLTNLALTFPGLSAAEFRPWIDEVESKRAGVSADDSAASTAQMWKDGLASWGIDPGRIASFRAGTQVTIYTPGSNSGIPLNLVGALAAPAGDDVEASNDEALGFVTGLLSMAGIEADPLTSPEHILLTNLISDAWSKGKDLDLTGLLGLIQDPPMRKLGVIDLDTFYPPKDRQALLIRLNGLLASPSFQAWSQGPPADIEAMLWTPDGRPRAAVVTLSHLSDTERQFVVTLLLSKMITWMRSQPGTSSLRAMIYMDEVFGYIPPTENPPAKKPILTILKQARAFGVGMVLSTQNPVDIDYKALSNAGTWMVGRLQTERDKARLLEGMTAASGGVDTTELSVMLSALGKREFVLHSTSSNAPQLFTTRWAMSYLRGPLTRDQISDLVGAEAHMAPTATDTSSQGSTGAGGAGTGSATDLADDESSIAPPVADGRMVAYLDPGAPWTDELDVDVISGGARFEAAVVARVALVFDQASADVRVEDEFEAVLFPLDGAADWSRATIVDYDDRDLRPKGPESATYRLPSADVSKAAWFRDAERSLKAHLRQNQAVDLLQNKRLKLTQRPGEDAATFAVRCDAAAENEMDKAADALRSKLIAQRDTLAAALADAEDRVEDLEEDKKRRRTGSFIQAAGSILGGLLGGKRASRSLARSVTSAAGTFTKQTSTSLDSAERSRDRKATDLAEIEDRIITELQELDHEWEAVARDVTTVSVRLKASDIAVDQLALVWVPVG